MRNRRTILLTVIATALLALSLPSLAAAQGGYDPYGRNRDYHRDRDYRRDDRYGRYDNRYLRDSIRRLRDLSGRFQRDIDRALDHSHEDGSRHEDRLNDIAQDFHRAARELDNRFDDRRDLYRSADEAQRVLHLGERVGRAVQHHFYDGRLRSDWMQIRRELNVIADAYGYRNGGYYGGDDDYYRRNDPYRRNRNAQRVGDILRRIPW
ncbi:MAG TPA: hypothetical protein VF708_04900 [Pyrinomonadaceae bacterium]